jgi:hypothetical protein
MAKIDWDKLEVALRETDKTETQNQIVAIWQYCPIFHMSPSPPLIA